MQIKQIEQYHKGIDKKLLSLYVKISLADTNILIDDFQDFIKQTTEENQIPFEPDKFYEITIYCDYLEDESINMTERLHSQTEKLRSVLSTIRINQIYVFGKIVNENPGITVEIEEKDTAEYNHIFIMPDEDIYNRLLFRYKKQMIDRSLNAELNPKLKNKILKMIKEDYSAVPKISKQEIVDYAWAIHVVNIRGEEYIWDKRDNALIKFDSEFQVWVHSKFTKINDQRVIDDINETIKNLYLSNYKERLNNACKRKDKATQS